MQAFTSMSTLFGFATAMSHDLAAQCMVGDVTVDWELPSGGLYIMPSRHGVAAAFAEPGENNYRLVRPWLPHI